MAVVRKKGFKREKMMVVQSTLLKKKALAGAGGASGGLIAYLKFVRDDYVSVFLDDVAPYNFQFNLDVITN